MRRDERQRVSWSSDRLTKRRSPGRLDEQLVNPQQVYSRNSMPEYDLETNARNAQPPAHEQIVPWATVLAKPGW